MNLNASRVRLHDKQIYNLQVRMVRLEEGLKQLTDVTNFHIYASHQINVTQAAVFRLQLGLQAAEANVDKILPVGNDYPKGIPSRHPSYSPKGFIEEGQS